MKILENLQNTARGELEEEIQGYLDSFPDLKWNIDNIFAHDDQVLVEISGIGTRSTKAIDGGKPGTRVQFWVASVEHVCEGKIGDVPAAVEFGRVAAAPVNTLRQQTHRCQEISVCF